MLYPCFMQTTQPVALATIFQNCVSMVIFIIIYQHHQYRCPHFHGQHHHHHQNHQICTFCSSDLPISWDPNVDWGLYLLTAVRHCGLIWKLWYDMMIIEEQGDAFMWGLPPMADYLIRDPCLFKMRFDTFVDFENFNICQPYQVISREYLNIWIFGLSLRWF